MVPNSPPLSTHSDFVLFSSLTKERRFFCLRLWMSEIFLWKFRVFVFMNFTFLLLFCFSLLHGAPSFAVSLAAHTFLSWGNPVDKVLKRCSSMGPSPSHGNAKKLQPLDSCTTNPGFCQKLLLFGGKIKLCFIKLKENNQRKIHFYRNNR